MDLKKIGMFIAAKRKQKNLTQKELADKICVTDKAISRWETGKGFPDASLLIALSGELGVSVTEIIMGEEIQHKEECEVEILGRIDKAVIDTTGYWQREIKKISKELLLKIFLAGLLLGCAAVLVYYIFGRV